MPVKANWQNGEQFNASDANAVAEAVNAAYVKPATGVPITDLSSAVQVSLGKADTAVQSVTATLITDSTATGRAVLTAADSAAARSTLGVSYGTTAGTVVQGNDSRLSPTATSITDSTATGRALLTAADAAAARTALGVAYGTTAGTVVQGNDSRISAAEQTANKGQANGYASLDANSRVPAAQMPTSVATLTGQETLTQKTLTTPVLSNPTVNNYTEGVVALGTVGTGTTVLSIANGTVLTATLTASQTTTFTLPAVGAGKSFTLMVRQAASTGNGAVAWSASPPVRWSSVGAPTMTATAGRMDIFTFFSDGTNWYGSFSQGYTY